MSQKPVDLKKEPFKRMVILGESTVEGGPWLSDVSERYADILARLINECQSEPMEYINKGIGANAISMRSPGYEMSRKPSAMERYKDDVIANKPDLFLLCYGLNDMRANMPVADFEEDMATIIAEVKAACNPMIVLTTVYYMTGWKSWIPYNQGTFEIVEQYNACIHRLAERFGCVVADAWASEGGLKGGADWLIHHDGVHANRVGNMVIAHRIFETIAHHASGLTKKYFEEHADTEWTRETTAARISHGDPFTKTW